MVGMEADDACGCVWLCGWIGGDTQTTEGKGTSGRAVENPYRRCSSPFRDVSYCLVGLFSFFVVVVVVVCLFLLSFPLFSSVLFLFFSSFVLRFGAFDGRLNCDDATRNNTK